jgi:aspartyl/asparaginyl beta-hydroxylase (cupin superfamily)
VTNASDTLIEADRAAASGDLQRAEMLLSAATDPETDDLALLLKLAGVQRASGKPRIALSTVHRALTLEPHDFTALLMRASLLERLGDDEAPEAWAHAMVQKPASAIPPGLASVVAHGEQRVADWQRDREERLRTAMQEVDALADDELRHRFERFRSNVVRRTRTYHSTPTQFDYPGLPEREFYPRHLCPWLEKLEEATPAILEDLRAVMNAERAELVPYIQYEDHLPLAQWKALNQNMDWTAIHLLSNGEVVENNSAHCPKTMALLASLPQPDIRGASPNAMFSLLAPRTAIPAHVGVNNARSVCHLPLIVPEGCWFRVGAETRYWRSGEAFVFDDTIEHEALNPTDELRVVFIFDVWNPDLAPVEKQAVKALIEADGVSPSGSM